jgi:hypothetical protein
VAKKHLLEGMLAHEEIKEWAGTIEAQSSLNLIKFCTNSARSARRAVTEIAFLDGANEYRIWILRELNMIYVDGLHKGVEADPKLFRGPLTRRSLESISRILRTLTALAIHRTDFGESVAGIGPILPSKGKGESLK